MSAAQLDGALLERDYDAGRAFEGGSNGSRFLGDRAARYEFKRLLIRRLQATLRGVERSRRYRQHQAFIAEWRALQDDHEALSHLPLITGLLEGTLTLECAAANAGHILRVSQVEQTISEAPPAGPAPRADVPVQLSVLTS